MAKILIVEDEEIIREALALSLAQDGHQTLLTSRGEVVMDVVLSQNPDLILLDLMLPGIGGVEVCRALRQSGIETPVIMLTVKSDETDRVIGLEIGADDYVTKPFSSRELLARVHVQLRRGPGRQRGKLSSYRFGNVDIDFDNLEARRSGLPLALTAREFDILHLLIRNRGKLVTRAELLRSVWKHRTLQMTRTVDTHILNLRQKIEDNPAKPKHIVAVYGEGYKFIG